MTNRSVSTQLGLWGAITPAGKAFSSLVSHFESLEWKFETDPENLAVISGFSGENAQFRLLAVIHEDGELLEVCVMFPVAVPRERRVDAAEFCLRINYRSHLARFDLDFADGEVRCRASAPIVPGQLPDEVIRRCMGTALLAADRFFPALMRVLYSGESPEEAVEGTLAEMDSEEEEEGPAGG